MRLSDNAKSSAAVDLSDALPLSDVRGMAKRAQARPTPPTPPFSNNRMSGGNRMSANNGAATRLPESRSCDEILSADTDDNDEHVSPFFRCRLKWSIL